MNTCVYCKNLHDVLDDQVTPKHITEERAQQIWDERGAEQSLSMTAAECQAVHDVWCAMPDSATFMSAFRTFMKNGGRS